MRLIRFHAARFVLQASSVWCGGQHLDLTTSVMVILSGHRDSYRDYRLKPLVPPGELSFEGSKCPQSDKSLTLTCAWRIAGP
jgi:hypothetical protein